MIYESTSLRDYIFQAEFPYLNAWIAIKDVHNAKRKSKWCLSHSLLKDISDDADIDNEKRSTYLFFGYILIIIQINFSPFEIMVEVNLYK